MYKRLLYIVFFGVLVIQGCKLDPPDFFAPELGSPYTPLSPGTVWRYNVDIEGEPDVSSNLVSDNTTIFDKTIYHRILTVSRLFGTREGYISNANHNVILRLSTFVEGATIYMQIVNDTAAVGQNWIAKATDNGMVNGKPARLFVTTIERGIIKTVGDKTYPDVIHTQVELQYDEGDGGGYKTHTKYQFYVAKYIGLIETDAVTTDGQVTTSLLYDYTIK